MEARISETTNKTIHENNLAEIACNDFVNLSLDTNCTATVLLSMLLEDQQGPNSDYYIQIYNGNDLQPDLNFDASDINKIYTFKVFHSTTGNSCWGQIRVEDKLAPTILCSNDTVRCGIDIDPSNLGYPIPAYYPVTISVDTNSARCYYVDHWDACSRVHLCYTDELIKLDCDSIFSRIIIRHWTAKDAHGNTSTCSDSIVTLKANFTDIIRPLDYDGAVHPYIKCTDIYPKLPNGNPSPIYTGHPVPAGCDKLVATYSDLKIIICENTYKILRRWTIIDWCTKNVLEINQLIKVIDDVAPTFDVPENVFVGMKVYSCGSYGALPEPKNVVDCGKWTYTIFTRQLDELGNQLPISNQYVTYNSVDKLYYLDGAPEGKIWIIYQVSDLCGNVSTKQIEVGVEDKLLPIPICDATTIVSLTSNGTARVFAETFDDGSIDNCGIYGFKVRRMDDPCGNGTNVFGSYVDFCCEDVGLRSMVVLQVIDNSRNINTCMVEIIVQEKEPPQIVAPTDVTISCIADMSDLNKFGQVRLSEAERKNIIIIDNNYYSAPNYIAGRDGLATDNCSVQLEEIVVRNLVCNQGTIVRTFIAKDKQGLISSATQTIYVKNPNPFNVNNIIWPIDVTMFTCRAAEINPSVTGSPIYFNNSCATIAANYEDQLLSKVDSSCYKIFRKWTVVDWCQFNAQTNAGIFEHVQILYIQNTVAPDIYSCNDLEICDYNSYYNPNNNSCMVSFDIKADGEDDCTKKEFLKWSYRLDSNNDGVFEALNSGDRVVGVAPVGVFKIRWIVEDACGNVATCDQRVTLKDCKKPTPYCVNGITTVIMPLNGFITVWAKDLNINSFDNCTQKDALKYSFTSDVNDTHITYNCDSLGKNISVTKKVRIYVTDESGNQDYCETAITIQDNNKVCGNTFVNVSGLVSRSDNKLLPGTKLKVSNELNENLIESTTDVNGKYSFQSLPLNTKFKVSAEREDDILNGVSTFDIILIQKNILGKTPFNSPFQYLAADVNNSKSITARDISDLRKVILGIRPDFPGKEIWNFVPANYKFSDIESPWDVSKDINFKDLSEDYSQLNFVGYKKGDIDNSSIIEFTKNSKVRNSAEQWMVGEPNATNNTYVYPVYSTTVLALEGFQTRFQILNPVSLISGSIQIDENNYNIQNNVVSISWNSNSQQIIHENEVLFYIETSTKNLHLEQIHQNGFNSELYLDHELKDLVIVQSKDRVADFSFELKQNIPNPYFDQTVVPIEVTKSCSMVLTVYNISGKQILEKNLLLEKGLNYVNIDRAMLGAEGIYLYKLEGNAGSQVKKMILKF